MATKQELYSTEQHIKELDHTLQQAEQKNPQYLSKRLNSLELQTSNISFLVEAVDALLKRTNESIFECYKSTMTNTIIHTDKQFTAVVPGSIFVNVDNYKYFDCDSDGNFSEMRFFHIIDVGTIFAFFGFFVNKVY